MPTKTKLKDYRAQCQDEIEQVILDALPSLRGLLPFAPDDILRSVAKHDPEVKRLIKFWARKHRYYARLLAKKKN